jgi:hypothetical protein
VGGLRRKLETLQEKSGYQRMTLVCPECDAEFVAYGDLALELIVLDWQMGQDEESASSGHHKTPEDILRIYNHEHDTYALIEKTTGLPWTSREVSGIDFGGEARGPSL